MSGGAKTKQQRVQGASAPARTRAGPALGAKLGPADERSRSNVTLAAAPTDRTNELVFVDSSTPHYESLIEDMRTAAAEGRRLEFVLIDAWRDGVHKITETLIQKRDLDAIHIVPRARDGAVQLGSAELDFDTLHKRAAQITAWCDALNANGDILLYGGDLAASQEGKALLEALLRLTGADKADEEDPASWRLDGPTTVGER